MDSDIALSTLLEYLHDFIQKRPKDENEIRNKISEICLALFNNDPEYFKYLEPLVQDAIAELMFADKIMDAEKKDFLVSREKIMVIYFKLSQIYPREKI